MTNSHKTSLWLSSSLLLALALSGCGLTNSEAQFTSDAVLIEVGSSYDVVLSDVADMSTLHVRGGDEHVGATLMTVPGFLIGERNVLRVESLSAGTSSFELWDDGTLLDTIAVEATTVARFDVVADEGLYGQELTGDYGILVGQDAMLTLVARDELDRPLDAFVSRSMGVDGGFDIVFGWDDLYVFRAAEAGTHTLTLEGDAGADISVDMTVVDPGSVSALHFAVSEQNRGTCVAVSGTTEVGLPVLGMTPAFMVDGEASDIASELGMLCFEEEPARGTEVTAIWHTLSVTHTF